MAKNNIEVEVKISITKVVFDKLDRYLKKNAKHISSNREIDRYYNAPHRDFSKVKPIPLEYLRLRTKKNNSFFAYKKGNYSKGTYTHANEYETEIKNPESLEKILKVLNFTNLLVIDKKRKVYRLNKWFDVSLDDVKKLGYFVEIESLKDFGGQKKTMAKIYELVRRLELDPDTRNQDGYVFLMMKKLKMVNSLSSN